VSTNTVIVFSVHGLGHVQLGLNWPDLVQPSRLSELRSERIVSEFEFIQLTMATKDPH
jgi:hypothetical protein